jgi:hypothetical protein
MNVACLDMATSGDVAFGLFFFPFLSTQVDRMVPICSVSLLLSPTFDTTWNAAQRGAPDTKATTVWGELLPTYLSYINEIWGGVRDEVYVKFLTSLFSNFPYFLSNLYLSSVFPELELVQ